jgi:hypothetical protein
MGIEAVRAVSQTISGVGRLSVIDLFLSPSFTVSCKYRDNIQSRRQAASEQREGESGG